MNDALQQALKIVGDLQGQVHEAVPVVQERRHSEKEMRAPLHTHQILIGRVLRCNDVNDGTELLVQPAMNPHGQMRCLIPWGTRFERALLGSGKDLDFTGTPAPERGCFLIDAVSIHH